MDFGEPEHIGMLRESIRRMLERHADARDEWRSGTRRTRFPAR